MQTITVEVLADKLARLKLESKSIQTEIDTVNVALLEHMKPGTAVNTPEYRVTCQPGRSSFKWNNPTERKAVEANAFKQGMGDFTVGKPFIDCRFLKQADYAE
jgi:hypothetical protein